MAPGENRIEAEVTNEGNTGGFVLQLVTDKAEVNVVTGDTWTATAKRGDKDGVKARQVAKYGDQPWGKVLDQSAAGGGSRVRSTSMIFRLSSMPFSFFCLSAARSLPRLSGA